MILSRAQHGYVELTLDDGKVNALSLEVLLSLNDAMLRARECGNAVLIKGRVGCFSAGYNLNVMQAGGEAKRQLRAAGDQLKLAMLEHPYPVVIACTGHALAKGALLLLCADHRIGMEGAFRIGLNETAVGIELPQSAIELVQARVALAMQTSIALNAQILAPQKAYEAGFFDELVPKEGFLNAVHQRLEALLMLDQKAYATTKARLRAPLIQKLKTALAAEAK